MMAKKINIFLMVIILALFLTIKGYAQKGNEKAQDTSTVEKNKQQESAKSIENKQEDKGQQSQDESKQKANEEQTGSKKSKEQIEATETETEEITPEEDEWGGNVWDTKSVERRESGQRQRNRIEGSFDTDEMWKY
jgi:septal ring-binding cell division protein DamX